MIIITTIMIIVLIIIVIVSASRHPPRPLGGLEAQRLRGQEMKNDIR